MKISAGHDLRHRTSAGFWLNILHLHGEEVMFTVSLITVRSSWRDRNISVLGQRRFSVLCGGLRRWETMVLGTPEQVIAEARDAIMTTGGKRFILGTGCVLPIISPRGNILAARRSVEFD
jgi:uroporphyrinogen decarboxylase